MIRVDLRRVRKAVAAGASTAVGSVWAALVNGDKPSTAQGWGALIGGAVALGVVAGLVTYGVRNTGAAVNDVGSDARPGEIRPWAGPTTSEPRPYDVSGGPGGAGYDHHA